MKTKTPTLKDCPASGTGVHAWVFYAACTLVEADLGLADEKLADIIGFKMSRAPSPPTEIEDALRSARREEREPSQKWPSRNLKLIHKILQEPEWEVTPMAESAQEALELLFPGDALLCIGRTSSNFSTKRRTAWTGWLGRNSLIVPSPMSAQQGQTKAGHMSEHSLANTGERHYLIVEFDWGKIEGQLKLLRHLSRYGLLVQVVHSGSKSAHGWFDVRGRSEVSNREFMVYAVSLGADPRMWLRSQFCRLPGGTRDDGRAQKILYLAQDFLRKRSNKWKPNES
jgi:hypothetical protein